MPGNPGKMNRRLTFQTRTLSSDSAGGRTETWVDSFDAWAEMLSHKAAEKVMGEAERSEDVRHFRIRYRSGIGEGTHRVLYKLKFYDIEGVTEEGIQDRLVIHCKALQSLTNP